MSDSLERLHGSERILEKRGRMGKKGRSGKKGKGNRMGMGPGEDGENAYSSGKKWRNKKGKCPFTEMTRSERENLPDSAFVFPDERAWPIHDKKHAKIALTWASWPQHKDVASKVRKAVYKKYPKLKGKDECNMRKNLNQLGSIMEILEELQESELGSIELDLVDEVRSIELYLAKKGKRYAVVFWDSKKNQFYAPSPGSGRYYSSGWSEKSVNYVANWKSRSGVRRDLEIAKEEMEMMELM